jgi:hypothetical protein
MATKKTTTKKATARKATAKKASPKKATTKPAAKKSAKEANAKPKKLSAIDAAAKVLGESKQPMSAREMIDAMAAKGYWKSPGGKTPWATLYSAVARSIKKDGKDSRFKKTERGKFAANA